MTKNEIIEHIEEMIDSLRPIPDKWFIESKGVIMIVCTRDNVGVNMSLDLLDLTREQKIGIVAQVSNKIGLAYHELQEYMAIGQRNFRGVTYKP